MVSRRRPQKDELDRHIVQATTRLRHNEGSAAEITSLFATYRLLIPTVISMVVGGTLAYVDWKPSIVLIAAASMAAASFYFVSTVLQKLRSTVRLMITSGTDSSEAAGVEKIVWGRSLATIVITVSVLGFGVTISYSTHRYAQLTELREAAEMDLRRAIQAEEDATAALAREATLRAELDALTSSKRIECTPDTDFRTCRCSESSDGVATCEPPGVFGACSCPPNAGDPASTGRCGRPPAFKSGPATAVLAVVPTALQARQRKHDVGVALLDAGGQNYLPWLTYVKGIAPNDPTDGPAQVILVNGIDAVVAEKLCRWLTCGGWDSGLAECAVRASRPKNPPRQTPQPQTPQPVPTAALSASNPPVKFRIAEECPPDIADACNRIRMCKDLKEPNCSKLNEILAGGSECSNCEKVP